MAAADRFGGFGPMVTSDATMHGHIVLQAKL